MGELRSSKRRETGGARLILALSGAPGVGKTTLARALADRLEGSYVSFGDHIRALAHERSKPLDRSTLQLIGETLVTQDPKGLVSAVLAQAPVDWQTLVMDGVRHVSVLNLLREFAHAKGATLHLIHLSLDISARRARMALRGTDPATAHLDERHLSEQDVAERLARAADVRLHGDCPIRDLVELVVDRLPAEWRPSNFGDRPVS